MSRFLAAYEDLFAKSTDAPVEFGHAGGLAVLSTIALRRRYLEQGVEIINPNLFMLLCADSSRDRKSTSVKLACKILKRAGVKSRVGPDNFTPEGLYRFLDEEGKEMLLPIGEFGTFLAQANGHSKNLPAEMCKLYDGEDLIKVRAKETLRVENPLVSLFGGVAYGMLEKYMKQDEWDMGFYPRMLWVTPVTRRTPFIIVPSTPKLEEKIVIDRLEDLIIQLGSSNTEMGFESDAKDDYEKFVAELITDEQNEDATVNAQRERLKNIVWKLGMLYQIDIDPKARIGKAAMDRAYAFARISWTSFRVVFNKTYGAAFDRYVSRIWQYIWDTQCEFDITVKAKLDGKIVDKTEKVVGVWRSDVNHWQHRRLKDLEAGIATLIQRGIVQDSVVTVRGKDTKYYKALYEPPK